jgi:hypothetical protein
MPEVPFCVLQPVRASLMHAAPHVASHGPCLYSIKPSQEHPCSSTSQQHGWQALMVP